ncbi:MAG: 5-formyltetrahydrofolate cyclo-ligase [Ruminococcus sp.]|nr:5-formyltetrahydrofolate cyclo-ligase [Ruminococcus sp.]
MDEKKLLRRKFSEIRKNIDGKCGKDIAIAKRFMDMEILKSADTVLLYASFGSEIDTFPTAYDIIGKNIQIAYPKSFRDGIMTFHIVKSPCELKKGMYGISEPDGRMPTAEITDNTVCILPGLAFMENGGRLGYGGGYYDRFLEKYPHIHKVAFSYEELITDSLPVMQHDARADYIVTPERTVLCNAERRR